MNPILLPAGLVAATLLGVWAVRARPAAQRLAAECVLLLAIAALLMARGTAPLPSARPLAGPDGPWLRALAVMWWLVGARLVATASALALGRDAHSRQARLFSDLVAGGIYLSAVFVVLNSVLDLPVRGLLATSGVIAIVLGLALQNTLADLFSGIAVGVEQPFGVGDRVSIGSDVEGVVVEMNWRAIRLQTDSADIATVPNSIVAKSQLINRSRPTERRGASVEIPIRSHAPAARLFEAIHQALLLCPALCDTPAPAVMLKAIGPRETLFSISYTVARSADLGTARGQVLRQVRRLLRHNGLEAGNGFGLAELLRELPLFATLSTEQLAQLAPALIPAHLEPGAPLFERGSHGESIYIVRTGVLDVRRPGEAGERSIGRLGPGEYIGEVSMMTGEPRHVTVAALTAVDYVELPCAGLRRLLAEDPRLGEALERAVKRGLALIERDAAALISQPVADRPGFLGKLAALLRGGSG
ncbi:cyclic nucleotide-binding domain-containing protein [Sphingomonas morindae]|uniref:Small-conductance mechanosensitive channel n=1 Tax=Sphingomonas morindae TaxID=1541170 RepID=A0ABY4XDR4_9SPHN|nr:mechanosensitive ion channel family protein [Sphingomonas morindae]USI74988.1 mechanosensitive ion channel family protein [Sphingomonas morindae]